MTPVDDLESTLKHLYYEPIDRKKTEPGYTPIADKKDGYNLVRLRQLVHTMKAMYMKLQPLLETVFAEHSKDSLTISEDHNTFEEFSS